MVDRPQKACPRPEATGDLRTKGRLPWSSLAEIQRKARERALQRAHVVQDAASEVHTPLLPPYSHRATR